MSFPSSKWAEMMIFFFGFKWKELRQVDTQKCSVNERRADSLKLNKIFCQVKINCENLSQ